MVEIFHVLNRGVDKRDIFLDDQDRFRFIHDLFEMNNQLPAHNVVYSFKKGESLPNIRRLKNQRRERELLVDIYAFVLMPNHYHLLISPRKEKNVSKFIQKLNIGYVKYFNQKYERQGTLFPGKTKKILVTDESHFIHLPYYIHLNPLDLYSPEWRERELKDFKSAIKFLETYRWSSHLDYAGIKNFPSVTNRDFLLKYFNGTEGYKKDIGDWLKSIQLENLEGITLE